MPFPLGIIGASGVAAVGEDGPTAGTVVIGSDSYGSSNAAPGQAGVAYTNTETLLATWAEAAATTTISKLVIRSSGWDFGNAKGLIYTAAGSLVAVTNAVNYANYDELSAEFVFASPPTITKGDSYYLGVILDTASAINVKCTADAGNNIVPTTSGTYASPPASLAPGLAQYENLWMGIWAVV